MFSKEKTYEFSEKGLDKAISDRKNEVMGKCISIGVWSVIGILGVGGIISHYGIVKMVACTGTSKVVKALINLI